MPTDPLIDLAARVGNSLDQKRLRLATAESCTGGWIATAVTAVAGSSAWFERGFVTYSNEAKQESLGVAAELIASHGAVSEPVALAMAQGALRHSHADVAVSVTGIAGPGGATPGKPVGTVCLSWAGPGQRRVVRTCRFQGDREAVRRQSVEAALLGLLEALDPEVV
jgi:nicotinamide-nucleotide amidase